ncbi:hypothetical protein MRX96_058261 [Rhipicephalus microplus]
MRPIKVAMCADLPHQGRHSVRAMQWVLEWVRTGVLGSQGRWVQAVKRCTRRHRTEATTARARRGGGWPAAGQLGRRQVPIRRGGDALSEPD